MIHIFPPISSSLSFTAILFLSRKSGSSTNQEENLVPLTPPLFNLEEGSQYRIQPQKLENAATLHTIASTNMMDSFSSDADIFHSATSPTAYKASLHNSDEKSTRNTTSATAAATAKSLSRMMSDRRELLSRYTCSLTQLRKTFNDAETLLQENTNLRLANLELSNRINLPINITLQSQYNETPFSDFPGQDGYKKFKEERESGDCVEGLFSKNRSSVIEEERESGERDEGLYNKNQKNRSSVIEKIEKVSDHKEKTPRVSMPKSISVRSNGFLKMSQVATAPTRNDSALTRSVIQTKFPNPVSEPQKVYVRGGSHKNGSRVLDVYNQGMFKTELCNKWQETKNCPYEDHCQFAHGIEELRPVIRHPLYKTEVCRKVLADNICPYGHRCHFRHALTDEEKLMRPLRHN